MNLMPPARLLLVDVLSGAHSQYSFVTSWFSGFERAL